MPDILAERDGSLLVLTIDNPPKRNAFTSVMTLKLGGLFDAAESDPSVRCVLLTGAGDQAFSSGHDLNELLADRDHAADEKLNAPFTQPSRMTKPVIAVVNGAAHAGGFILALSCDMRVCEPQAEFAAPGARIGLLPIGGQLSRFPTMVPPGIAFEILATGRRVQADEARRIGFANHVAASGEAMSLARTIGRSIAANSSVVVHGIKQAFGILAGQGAVAADAFEWAEGGRLQNGPDADEGVRAFLEKRAPCFA